MIWFIQSSYCSLYKVILIINLDYILLSFPILIFLLCGPHILSSTFHALSTLMPLMHLLLSHFST